MQEIKFRKINAFSVYLPGSAQPEAEGQAGQAEGEEQIFVSIVFADDAFKRIQNCVHRSSEILCPQCVLRGGSADANQAGPGHMKRLRTIKSQHLQEFLSH